MEAIPPAESSEGMKVHACSLWTNPRWLEGNIEAGIFHYQICSQKKVEDSLRTPIRKDLPAAHGLPRGKTMRINDICLGDVEEKW